jgi:hypothetical protein
VVIDTVRRAIPSSKNGENIVMVVNAGVVLDVKPVKPKNAQI